MIPLMFLLGQQQSTQSTGPLPIPNCTSNCDNTFTHPVNIGDVYEGGYYAGAMKVGSDIFALIVSDKTQGQHLVNGHITGNIHFTLSTEDFQANSLYDGYSNTEYFINNLSNLTNYPAFNKVKQLNQTGFGIGGSIYNDWYLASRYEWIIVWRNLNPSNLPVGININTPPTDSTTSNFGYPCNPCQSSYLPLTKSSLFLSNGSQHLNFTVLWHCFLLSSWHSTNLSYYSMPYNVIGGVPHQFPILHTNYNYIQGPHIRLIRKVKLN